MKTIILLQLVEKWKRNRDAVNSDLLKSNESGNPDFEAKAIVWTYDKCAEDLELLIKLLGE